MKRMTECEYSPRSNGAKPNERMPARSRPRETRERRGPENCSHRRTSQATRLQNPIGQDRSRILPQGSLFVSVDDHARALPDAIRIRYCADGMPQEWAARPKPNLDEKHGISVVVRRVDTFFLEHVEREDDSATRQCHEIAAVDVLGSPPQEGTGVTTGGTPTTSKISEARRLPLRSTVSPEPRPRF